MKPVDIQQIGEELAIKWEDGSEGFVRLADLRRACPCASCKGEVDVLGRIHRGIDKPLNERSFKLIRLNMVGGYAVQPVWEDGHSSGLFAFDYLKRVTEVERRS